MKAGAAKKKRILARRAPLRAAPVAVALNEALETARMLVAEFDFDLPENRIALKPANPRDCARLLHVEREASGDFTVADLPRLLKKGDLLVLNDTKVIPAQLTGRRAARGGDGDVAVDVTLIKRLMGDPEMGARWKAFARPAKRIRENDILAFGERLRAQVESRHGPEAILRFNCNGSAFDRLLIETGAPPLPPYIARKRRATADDIADYQTVFAKEEGSVAAPTAGLHFTQRLFDKLREAGIGAQTITLHVGAGTFLPVTVDDTDAHQMHSEWGEITAGQADQINQARKEGRRIVAVGTTSLRLLESAADEFGDVQPFSDETDIFITPGYRFRVVDALLTNFHLPRSTLFMLVCAFAGTERMKRAYGEAIERNYRFFSYGDACLLERAK
ncbi:MAG: tRNA preQ1(34) S-adenosylmethionine ribosyltransferase-isomerase QueA [Parvularculaceae bacterium]|nr:tRNA preQ1(34) S-adenosylmethionine ribosyltransferase-isomerase QueA [Parvularculaceae bacterium]